MSTQDFGDFSPRDLFRQEVEEQAQTLTAGLLALERDAGDADHLDACMRAAHSLKGAARIVGFEAGVTVAHAMEDCLVGAQRGALALLQPHIDGLLEATDLMARLAAAADFEEGAGALAPDVDICLDGLRGILGATPADAATDEPVPDAAAADVPEAGEPIRQASSPETAERVLRVTAENLSRLLGLASESLVESRWVRPFGASLLRLRRLQQRTVKALEAVSDALVRQGSDEHVRMALADAVRRAHECERMLAERLGEIEVFERRSVDLSRRLYDEALACRMRPFGDSVRAFPRLVRDLARSLGKRIRLDIAGESTPVDRDILAALDAPLGHLVRNAVDHGLESPAERAAAGKPDEGLIRLEARHAAGMLRVTVADDGRGIDLDRLRERVVARGLTTRDGAGLLQPDELLEFLFLPGFSMKETITEISGRGVGLDVVRDMVGSVHGIVRLYSDAGAGTRFELQVPVTLSVMRALIVEIGGEPYAVPLAQIVRTARLSRADVHLLEGRHHFSMGDAAIGLVTAHQILGVTETSVSAEHVPVVVIGDRGHRYGVVVDRLLGERELVVQPLDPRLGKVNGIAAGAVLDDGSPVLILDTTDLIGAVDRIVTGGRVAAVPGDAAAGTVARRKRVLVVDDSLTVRELVRKLLNNRGYDVKVAVDGVDGWNVARVGHFDLVITDIDMPRMDGIELAARITGDHHLYSTPVIVVSYKDRDEDRQRGLEAGAARYLTKGSFHDETLLDAVLELIGEARA